MLDFENGANSTGSQRTSWSLWDSLRLFKSTAPSVRFSFRLENRCGIWLISHHCFRRFVWNWSFWFQNAHLSEYWFTRLKFKLEITIHQTDISKIDCTVFVSGIWYRYWKLYAHSRTRVAWFNSRHKSKPSKPTSPESPKQVPAWVVGDKENHVAVFHGAQLPYPSRFHPPASVSRSISTQKCFLPLRMACGRDFRLANWLELEFEPIPDPTFRASCQIARRIEVGGQTTERGTSYWRRRDLECSTFWLPFLRDSGLVHKVDVLGFITSLPLCRFYINIRECHLQWRGQYM